MFPTELQRFQYYDKYARFDWQKRGRESWAETVNRAVNFLRELGGNDLTDYVEIEQNILGLKVMPSMRLLAMAGPAARRTNVCLYNCSFMGIRDIRAFGEILMISMCGCGVGFSVEKKFVDQLPKLPEYLRDSKTKFVVPDTTEGWQAAIDYLFECIFYSGTLPSFDYSQIRPTGAPLKTKGGQASGPEIFKQTIDFIIDLLYSAILQKRDGLKPIEVYDIACSLGNAAVSGGIRRTAMISLFDIDDEEMMLAKKGNYNHFRWNANNSVVYNGEMGQEGFLAHMGTLFGEGNGEPCIFSLENARRLAPDRRNKSLIEGVNPCGEINLRDCSFCNLSAAISREDDTLESLFDKIRIATIIGTIQSTATHFPGLRPEWQRNCKEERLLGVDITGQMDCPLLVHDDGRIREQLKEHAIRVNRLYAEKLGINQSASITCVKPSGNTSQLVDCASGMNPRWSRFYRRNVRVSVNSPVYKVLLASGVKIKPENGQTLENMTTAIVSFPVKSPVHAVVKEDLSLQQKLTFWKLNKICYTEHNPSVTITYKPDEILQLVNWIWQNRDILGGLTFLPESTDKYDNMPYETITEEEYLELSSEFPRIKWNLLPEFEQTDFTTAAQELACVSGLCEI